MKPQMEVYQTKGMSLLAGSGKGVYGSVDGASQLKYGGYITDDEAYDPD